MSIQVTHWIDGIAVPTVALHRDPKDGVPYVFVTVGPYGRQLDCAAYDPASLRKLAAAYLEAARQLDEAQLAHAKERTGIVLD